MERKENMKQVSGKNLYLIRNLILITNKLFYIFVNWANILILVCIIIILLTVERWH